MKILTVIEDPEVIKKILKHVGLWDIKARLPPKPTATPPDFHFLKALSYANLYS